MHRREIIRRYWFAGPLLDDRREHRLHRFDFHPEVTEGVDEMGSDGSPDPAALFRVAPPVPWPAAIAAAGTRVTHFRVANRSDVRDALARGDERRQEAKFVIDDRNQIRTLSHR